jgi:hypothetical protein
MLPAPCGCYKRGRGARWWGQLRPVPPAAEPVMRCGGDSDAMREKRLVRWRDGCAREATLPSLSNSDEFRSARGTRVEFFFFPPRESERATSFFRPRRHGTGCGGAGGPRDVDVSGQKNENVAARAPSESLGVDEFRIGISSPCCCWWMSGGVERKRDAQMAMGGSWKKWRRCKRVEIFWLTPTCLVCIRPCKPFWRCTYLGTWWMNVGLAID